MQLRGDDEHAQHTLLGISRELAHLAAVFRCIVRFYLLWIANLRYFWAAVGIDVQHFASSRSFFFLQTRDVACMYKLVLVLLSWEDKRLSYHKLPNFYITRPLQNTTSQLANVYFIVCVFKIDHFWSKWRFRNHICFHLYLFFVMVWASTNVVVLCNFNLHIGSNLGLFFWVLFLLKLFSVFRIMQALFPFY